MARNKYKGGTMGTSKNLGIIGLCLGWLIPLAGLVLGIIGLCLQKEKGKEDRDKTLNIVSIVIAIIFWLVWTYILI